MKNQNLFESLKQFEFPESFLPRLCRENGWTADQGLRVVEEYRKFVYLAMVSDAPVTPPLAVDQAWHLHLIYTRSYWEELCLQVLPRPLHHGPTKGGAEEDNKFRHWYERTLILYRDEFGQCPPAAVWPSAEVRFDPKQRLRYLDTSRFWMIPKQATAMMLPSVAPLALGFNWLGVGATLAVFSICLLLVMRMAAAPKSRRPQDGDGSNGCGGGVDFAALDSSSEGSGDAGGDGGGGCSSGCGGGGCGGGD